MQIPSSIYFSLVNFALFAAGLGLLLRRPVRDFFGTRAAALRKAVDEARAAKEVAARRAKEYADRLARIEQETAELCRRFVEEGEVERRLLQENASANAAKLLQDTERMIAQELRRTKEQLRNTTVDLAILLAERYLREQMGPSDQRRMVQSYVQRMGQLQ